MPAQRKPSSVLEAKGAFKHDPSRKREDFNSGEFDRSAPEYFNEGQRQAWDEIVRLLPAGVLQATDRLAVEMTARLMANFRVKDDDDVTMAQVTQLRMALASLGMTPADRSRVTQPKNAPQNPFADLVGKKAH